MNPLRLRRGLILPVVLFVLPLVPAYLCFVAGTSLDQVAGARGGAVMAGAGGGTVIADGGAAAVGVTRRVAIYALAFVLGFSTVFVSLGATASRPTVWHPT